LPGNLQQNRQLEAVVQADQADLVVDGRKVVPADPVAAVDHAKPCVFGQIGFSTQQFRPYSLSTGK
jgi:hypothetical protein